MAHRTSRPSATAAATFRPSSWPMTSELNGEDLRPLPRWHRREVLQGVTLFGHEGLRLSEPPDAPGDLVFRAACQHGLEGIVSKRLDSVYRSGRVKSWVKTKCPAYERGRIA